eukprot:1798057-Rhodomonas_salina.1
MQHHLHQCFDHDPLRWTPGLKASRPRLFASRLLVMSDAIPSPAHATVPPTVGAGSPGSPARARSSRPIPARPDTGLFAAAKCPTLPSPLAIDRRE